MSGWTGKPTALSDDQVRELLRWRRLLEGIPTTHQLAERFHVSEETIRKYLRNRAVPKRHAKLCCDDTD